jgi:hypothetical protein
MADQHRGQKGHGRGGGRQDKIGAIDQEKAAEEQGLDVGPGFEDVAGEDHAPRQAADEDQGDDAVASTVSPAEGGVTEAEADGGGERAQRRAESKTVSEDEAGEGGGADRVGEEGQAPENYPGAKQPGRDREEQNLEEGTLDEGKVEGLEDEERIMRMSPVCI